MTLTGFFCTISLTISHDSKSMTDKPSNRITKSNLQQKIPTALLFLFMFSAVIFCSNAFCDGTPAVVPEVPHHHFHDHVNGTFEHHNQPDVNGVSHHHNHPNAFVPAVPSPTPFDATSGHGNGTFGHHHNRNHDLASSQPVTTPFNVTKVEGHVRIRQYGDITIIKVFSSHAILEGNLSTDANDIIKIFGLSPLDTILLR